MIHHDIIISAFRILMGAPESTPSSFGTSIIAVGPGQEHKLLVTPTFIRSHVGVTFKINSIMVYSTDNSSYFGDNKCAKMGI